MSRIRIPYPWEDIADPLESASTVDYSRIVAMPRQGEGGGSLPVGEILAERTRDTRAAMARDLLDATDGSPAARQWAEAKAATAAQNWDRGVRNGSIPRPT